MIFNNRKHAAELLVKHLEPFRNREDVLILAISAGGISIAVHVANSLQLPADIFLVKKVKSPGQNDLAIGSLAPDNLLFLNKSIIRMLDIQESELKEQVSYGYKKLIKQETAFKGFHSHLEIEGKTIILIDDIIETGVTVKTGLLSMQKLNADNVYVAVPVANINALKQIHFEPNQLICLHETNKIGKIDDWYDDSKPVDKQMVQELLLTHQAAEHY